MRLQRGLGPSDVLALGIEAGGSAAGRCLAAGTGLVVGAAFVTAAGVTADDGAGAGEAGEALPETSLPALDDEGTAALSCAEARGRC